MKAREIADLVGGELFGDGDADISGVSAPAAAGRSDLVFFASEKDLTETSAGCVIVPRGLGTGDRTVIRVNNPKYAFAVAAKALHPFDRTGARHPTAIVAAGADVRASHIGAYASIGEGSSVGEGSYIAAGARIGRNVKIGERSVIHANVVIYDNVTIGSDCVIHAGAVIGADGFGYVRGPDGYVQFPQIGTVVIEDKVEIGANSCIDRGALGETRIGEGTKIDNLVQVAHNVTIGKRVVIAAECGISGSSVIGDDCVLGGQVGIADHARVMSGAVIGAQAAVLPGKIVRAGVWWGTPVQPLDEYKRQNALVKGLGRLRDEVKRIRRELAKQG